MNPESIAMRIESAAKFARDAAQDAARRGRNWLSALAMVKLATKLGEPERGKEWRIVAGSALVAYARALDSLRLAQERMARAVWEQAALGFDEAGLGLDQAERELCATHYRVCRRDGDPLDLEDVAKSLFAEGEARPW